MKKVQVIFGVVLLMLSLFLINCNKDKLGISFEINDSFDFTMESGSIINLPFDILTPDVTTNSAGEFEQNDTRADKIKEIKLKDLILSITSPKGKTFSFLKSIEIYISADELPEILIASKYDISENVNSIRLTCTDTDLANYVKKDKYKVRVKSVTKESITEDRKINCAIRFAVKATPLK